MNKSCRAAVVVLVALAVAPPTESYAGSYQVYACRLPNGAAAPASGWITTLSTVGGAGASNRCPGGAMQVIPLNRAHQPGWRYGFAFDAPPGTGIVGYSHHLEGNTNTVPLGPPPWDWEAGEFGTRVATPGEEITLRIACGNCGPFSDQVADRLDQPYSQLVVGLQCWRYGSEPCQANGAHLEIRRMSVTLEDRHVPQILSSSGSLLAAGPHKGVQMLSLRLRDVGGGLYKSRTEVDGQRFSEAAVDDNLGLCRRPFVTPVPCKTAATLELPLDTGTLPDGVHQVVVRVFDATGSNAAVLGPLPITVDNVPDAPAAGRVSVGCPAGTARMTRSVARKVVPFGATALLSGRVSGSQAPKGAHVVAIDAFGQRVPGHEARILRTGRWRLRIRPAASGTVRAALMSAAGQPLRCTAPVGLQVRAGVRFSVTPSRLHNGDSISMRGSLRAPVVPSDGKSIVLEARARGIPSWSTVAVVRTDSKGRFQFRYRFRRTFQPTTYEFRAVAPRQRGYPYVRGWSRMRRARVLP